MAILARKNYAIPSLFARQETFTLALALSFPVVALDQFLHTSPGQFAASPAFQVVRWASDTLMAVPFFVAAVWVGNLIADRLGLQVKSRTETFGRALLISGSLAVFLIPGWFAYTELANLTQSADVAPVGHVHGAPARADAYWVGDHVIYALLLAAPAVAAAWIGYRIVRRRTRSAGIRGVLARSWIVAALLGGVGVLAWFLHQAANRADSSRVYYTSALQFVHVHSHQFFAPHHGAALPPVKPPPVTTAPFSFAYQVARAFQDGLIAQAVGLPVVALVLLWGAWQLRNQDQHHQEGPLPEEVAQR